MKALRSFYPEEAQAILQQYHKRERHMILATIKMTLPNKKRDEAMKVLRSRAERCRDYPGCLSSHIYGDEEENNALLIEEVWKTQEDLDLHLRSDEYRNMLLVLEMAVKHPEIRFDIIESSTGIETIEKARSNAK
jgi:quinol monooxygenase YgiN